MTSLPGAFDDFLGKLDLTPKETSRIDGAFDHLQKHIVKEVPNADESDVVLQGSYPNGTAIRPADADGEFDVDGCAIIFDDDVTVADAFDQLEEVLRRDAHFDKNMNLDSKRCIRIEYAKNDDGSGFHLDVVGARRAGEGTCLEIPIRDDGWRETDPEAFRRWCEQQPSPFAEVVRCLKRWRDIQPGKASVKSIALQVLIARHLQVDTTDIGVAIEAVLRGIANDVGDHEAPPELTNPTLQSENLADTWEAAEFRKFRNLVKDAATQATAALNNATVGGSHDDWRLLLGEDFPEAPKGDVAKKMPPAAPAPGAAVRPQVAPNRGRYG